MAKILGSWLIYSATKADSVGSFPLLTINTSKKRSQSPLQGDVTMDYPSSKSTHIRKNGKNKSQFIDDYQEAKGYGD